MPRASSMNACRDADHNNPCERLISHSKTMQLRRNISNISEILLLTHKVW